MFVVCNLNEKCCKNLIQIVARILEKSKQELHHIIILLKIDRRGRKCSPMCHVTPYEMLLAARMLMGLRKSLIEIRSTHERGPKTDYRKQTAAV